ncbi:glycosyltransferase [Candidatus Woesebacteria bacterium]|nr:glycosyltransferase [Candidatus Woesebacteria bacterium]
MRTKQQLTIIIPTLNEDQYLPLLLQDLEAQSLQHFDVIIVDSGSTDNTLQLAKDFANAHPHTLVIQTDDQNVSKQRNIGASKATSEYLLFVDADTRLPSYYIQALLEQTVKKPSDSFTTFAIPDTDRIADKLLTSANNALSVGSAWIKKPYAFGACLGCTKKAFDLVKGFNPSLSFQEDADFLQRIVNNKMTFEIYLTPEYVFCMRRYQKEGTLNVILKTIPFTLQSFTKSDFKDPSTKYPMHGGKYYKNSKQEDR